MDQARFEQLLDDVAAQLTGDMRAQPESEWFSSALSYEQHVRERLHHAIVSLGKEGEGHEVDLHPSGQTFPDVPCGEFGVEVKFTKEDKWASIANSIRETKRVEGVRVVYLMFGKMGGVPESRWMRYEDCVVHVRTSHEPRFQVDLSGGKPSLFELMGISYDDFRKLDIMEKMPYIRAYARTIHPAGRLWWLEDTESGEEHSTDVDPVLYTSLDDAAKARYRAEAALLSPKVLGSGRVRDKYNDAVLFMLTYHGVLCHQARDLFSAGSAAGVHRSDHSGEPQIMKALKLLQDDMLQAADDLDPALFREYWGVDVAKEDRIAWWLEQADRYASGWVPSDVLFVEYQMSRGEYHPSTPYHVVEF